MQPVALYCPILQGSGLTLVTTLGEWTQCLTSGTSERPSAITVSIVVTVIRISLTPLCPQSCQWTHAAEGHAFLEWKVPFGHFWQSISDAEPKSEEKLPASHSLFGSLLGCVAPRTAQRARGRVAVPTSFPHSVHSSCAAYKFPACIHHKSAGRCHRASAYPQDIHTVMPVSRE